MLQAEQIQKNYEKHLKIIDHYIGDRKEAVKAMLSHMEDTYVMAPASSKTWYHNAFAGGYVEHVNRVVEYAVKQMKLYQEMGGNVDFTEEELVFAALFHDLGKIGDGDNANYIPQTDKWDTNVYDMRLTQHDDGWIYGVFCTERKDPNAPQGDTSTAMAEAGIVRTKDLKKWQRLPDLISTTGQQRNVVLFPHLINLYVSCSNSL